MFRKQLPKYYSDSTIKKAVNGIMNSWLMDAGSSCTIDIVKKDLDSVHIESDNRPTPFLLPWKIDNKPSYDPGINSFLSDLLSPGILKTNRLLTGFSMQFEVIRDIYYNFAEKPLVYNNWHYDHPENLNLLKSHFEIRQLRLDGIYGKCLLASSTLPPNVTIDATIDISDAKNIEDLIRFNNTLAGLVKQNNFVFRYYIPAGSGITFLKYLTIPSYNVDTGFIKKRLPGMKRTSMKGSLYFTINSVEGDSKWILLSDNRLILFGHQGSRVADIPATLLALQQTSGYTQVRQRLFLFDNTGKILEVSPP